MKFFKAVFVLITLTFFVSLVQAESNSETVEIKEWDESNNNIVIYRSSDQQTWLLHSEENCDFLEGAMYAKLVTEDFLDGYGASTDDALQPIATGYGQSCKIDQAEMIDAIFYIQGVSSSGAYLILKDTSNPQSPFYDVDVANGCDSISDYAQKNIYLQRSGYAKLNEGDSLFLPDKNGQCYISNVKEVVENTDSSSEAVTVPSRVENVWVLPGSEKVLLFWDEVPGADQYIIGYSEYHIDVSERTEELIDMPHVLKTDEKSIEIPNLNNSELYFFYVAAEKSGITSSRWSDEITATPESYLAANYDRIQNPVEIKNQNQSKISVQETLTHFIFNWEKTTMSQNFILKDEKNVLMSTNRFRNDQFYFLKTPQRKGKVFELSVNGTSINFNF